MTPAYICPRCGAAHAPETFREVSTAERWVRCPACRRKYRLVRESGKWKPKLIPGLKQKRFGNIGRIFNA